MTHQNKDLHEVEDPDAKYYEPKPEGEKHFWKQHVIKKHMDRNGNGDDVFGASNIKKDDTVLPKHKDKLGTPKGNRPVDQLKGEKGVNEEKMTSAEKSKREEIVKSMKKKTADFKSRYGDRWKDVMYATATKQAMGEDTSLEEDSQAATSDNPGGAQTATGTVDNNNMHLSNNPTKDSNDKGQVKDVLEKIAMQAAELHDSLEDGQDLEGDAQSMLNEAKDALEKVYEMVVQNQSTRNEEAELEEAGLYLNRQRWRGATPKLRVTYEPNAKDPYSPEEREAARKRLAAGQISKPAVAKEEFEEVDDAAEIFEEGVELEEATVKDSTGTIVGTHKPGEGFKPNALGKKLGHKPHPTEVPKGTTITKRGRPVGAKSFGASKRKDQTADEAGAHSEKPSFTDQLLKAADSRTGGHVTFDNGKTHHVPRAHATAGIYHLGKPEKPADKEKVRKHIGASKENFDAFRKSGGHMPKEAPKYDPDAKIKAKTASVVSKKVKSAKHMAMAQKILAMRKAKK